MGPISGTRVLGFQHSSYELYRLIVVGLPAPSSRLARCALTTKICGKKHMIAYGAQSLKIATSLVLRAQDFGDLIVCSGLLGAISIVVSSYHRSLVK